MAGKPNRIRGTRVKVPQFSFAGRIGRGTGEMQVLTVQQMRAALRLTPAQVASESATVASGAVAGAASRLSGPYTVATLPGSPTQGDTAFVTDALAPTFGATVVGGGAVVIPVFYDGAAWKVG